MWCPPRCLGVKKMCGCFVNRLQLVMQYWSPVIPRWWFTLRRWRSLQGRLARLLHTIDVTRNTTGQYVMYDRQGAAKWPFNLVGIVGVGRVGWQSLMEILSWHLSCNQVSAFPFLTKLVAISQTVFSDVFSWMKKNVFWLKFHWRLFLRV